MLFEFEMSLNQIPNLDIVVYRKTTKFQTSSPPLKNNNLCFVTLILKPIFSIIFNCYFLNIVSYLFSILF